MTILVSLMGPVISTRRLHQVVVEGSDLPITLGGGGDLVVQVAGNRSGIPFLLALGCERRRRLLTLVLKLAMELGDELDRRPERRILSAW